MTTLKIIYRPINELKKHKNNARTHSQAQIYQIINSINEFGWTNPILIDEHDIIIAGHGRLEAAETLELDKVPCIVLSGLTETQKRAYLIADNQLALNAGWDIDLLQSEIEALKLENFDIDLLGFENEELSKLINETESVDIDFGVDDSRGVSINYLSFGKMKIPLSDDELDNLLTLSEQYIRDYGSSYGFANHIMKGKL